MILAEIIACTPPITEAHILIVEQDCEQTYWRAHEEPPPSP